jgi:hypothetical protein
MLIANLCLEPIKSTQISRFFSGMPGALLKSTGQRSSDWRPGVEEAQNGTTSDNSSRVDGLQRDGGSLWMCLLPRKTLLERGLK